MAKKKAECYCCSKKGYQENYIEYQLDDEGHSIYFCSECCKEVTSEETILNEKIYLLFKKILGVKTLNKSVKGYIRNRLSEDYDDKRQVLFSIIYLKSGKLRENMEKKSFPNTTIKAKYIFASVEDEVEKEYKRQQEIEKAQTDFDIPVPLVKSVIKRVRNISKYL